MIDADPRLRVPAIPEVAQIPENVSVGIEIEEGEVERCEVRELEAEVEVRVADIMRPAAHDLDVGRAAMRGSDRGGLILEEDRDTRGPARDDRIEERVAHPPGARIGGVVHDRHDL